MVTRVCADFGEMLASQPVIGALSQRAREAEAYVQCCTHCTIRAS
jgi:hypothetical protein